METPPQDRVPHPRLHGLARRGFGIFQAREIRILTDPRARRLFRWKNPGMEGRNICQKGRINGSMAT